MRKFSIIRLRMLGYIQMKKHVLFKLMYQKVKSKLFIKNYLSYNCFKYET